MRLGGSSWSHSSPSSTWRSGSLESSSPTCIRNCQYYEYVSKTRNAMAGFRIPYPGNISCISSFPLNGGASDAISWAECAAIWTTTRTFTYINEVAPSLHQGCSIRAGLDHSIKLMSSLTRRTWVRDSSSTELCVTTHNLIQSYSDTPV